MTQRFLSQMRALGYTEMEAQQHWVQLMTDADNGDPVYAAWAEISSGGAAAREAYALSRIEDMPPKDGALSISGDPLYHDYAI